MYLVGEVLLILHENVSRLTNFFHSQRVKSSLYFQEVIQHLECQGPLVSQRPAFPRSHSYLSSPDWSLCLMKTYRSGRRENMVLSSYFSLFPTYTFISFTPNLLGRFLTL